jgi:hypothetical protein
MLGFVLETVLCFEKRAETVLTDRAKVSGNSRMRELSIHFSPKGNRTLTSYAEGAELCCCTTLSITQSRRKKQC